MLYPHTPDLMRMEVNNRTEALLADARQQRLLAQLHTGHTLWQRTVTLLQALHKRPSLPAPVTPAAQCQ